MEAILVIVGLYIIVGLISLIAKWINEKLNTEKYTILNTHQDMGNIRMYKYVLGRIVDSIG